MPSEAPPLPTPSVAPSPSPAPAPAPKQPPPTPAPTPSAEIEDNDDPFAELDQKLTAAHKKEEAPQPKKGETPPPKPEAKEKQVATPKNFREELDRTKSELKAKSEAAAKMEARIAEMEARGQDTTKLSEQLAAKDKELEDLRTEISGLKAEESPEFKAKYEKPFEDAAEYAKSVIEKFQVGEWKKKENPDGTEGWEWVATGKADWQRDYGRVWQMFHENPAQASELAEYLFGQRASSIVMQHVNDMARLDRQRQVAKVEERKTWKEKQSAKDAESIKQREALSAGVTKARADLIKRYAEWYDEVPEDAEGNEILKESRRLISEKPKTFQQAVLMQARLRLDAESAVRERFRNQKLKSEVEELKATIEAMKNGKPRPGGRSEAGGHAGADEDPLAELDAVFAKT